MSSPRPPEVSPVVSPEVSPVVSPVVPSVVSVHSPSGVLEAAAEEALPSGSTGPASKPALWASAAYDRSSTPVSLSPILFSVVGLIRAS